MRRAFRAPASRSTTPTWSRPAAAARRSAWPRRSRSQPSEWRRSRVDPAGPPPTGAPAVAILPQALRSLTPARLRDDVRLRAFAIGVGLIPPRTMHSDADARVLRDAARDARRVVEIGV